MNLNECIKSREIIELTIQNYIITRSTHTVLSFGLLTVSRFWSWFFSYWLFDFLLWASDVCCFFCILLVRFSGVISDLAISVSSPSAHQYIS